MSQPLQLALKFHEIYERLAPSFGYETRPETKAFNPDSNNGRLMIAVCAEILAAQQLAAACQDSPVGVERATPNAAVLEIDEYLAAQTCAAHALRVAQSPNGRDPLQDAAHDIRAAFRLHRFNVFTWLMQNGAKLPKKLFDDQIHPEVGSQGPDRPVPPT